MEQMVELVKSTKNIIFNEELSSAVTEKGLADYVTKVDTEVQSYLKEKLYQLRPDALFMGEEGEHKALDKSKPCWILDPIDGTTNLIHHYNTSAVSLALLENGKITKGIVYNPFTEQLFTSERGKGAYLNGKRISVSTRERQNDWLISIGTSPYEKDRADYLFELFKRIYKKTTDIRRSGSAALDLCYLACGMTDGYLEQNLKPWDYAAGSLILEEAGGRVTTWNGSEIDFYNNCDILAGTPKNHKMLLDEISKTLD